VSEAIDRLQALLAKRLELLEDALARALERLALAHADPGQQGRREAVEEVAALVSRLQACGDLSGRLALRFPATPAPKPELLASKRPADRWGLPGGPEDVVPWVPFSAAIEDMRTRDPIGAQALESMGLEVASVYGPLPDAFGGTGHPHGFAAAKAADADTARRVRDLLADSLEVGTPTPAVVKRLVRDWDWPRAYSENVARTNFATATTAGRQQEARRVEETTGLRVGFRFETAGDRNVRPTHKLMDGFTARQDDPVWRHLSPPLSYQCRCVLVPVFGDEVPKGPVQPPAGATADPGFGGGKLTRYGA
jgi:SPP1 gp7 family putative phage head morphogenesis protein